MTEPVTPDPSLYTTLDELKALMGVDPIASAGDTILNARLNGFISVVSRAIDAYCRRHFYPREETRYYTIPKSIRGRPWRLWLGYDLLELESLEADGITFAPETYTLCPLNQTVKGWIDLKHELIYGLPWSVSGGDTLEATLVGTWGFVTAESVAMIKNVCQLWIMELNQRSLYPGAQSVSIGDYSYSFRGDSEQRLNTPYGQTILTPPGQIALFLNGFRKLDLAGVPT